jgi:hypothetical protein
VLGQYQRSVRQTPEPIHHPRHLLVILGADSFGGFQAPATVEHGRLFQQATLIQA